ncbi:hypothetical protein T440DRAFT_473583 [Plenodomus tracheiphilus IPT5]|uniref:DUF4048 domain-containing protein n=1 Tax=Plenodomus tracheiphilus IPT5 TaxID=1408161 RepID=A0A6A7AM52_9PLEO|nr:hypothetical protein T440DRAFT_473583 [Plenodomus tracheiphilus IPT5]
MVSRVATPSLILKTLVWWFNKTSLPLRRLAAALLTLCFEAYSRSPATPSLILHRLARRVHLSTLLCTSTLNTDTGHAMTGSISYLGGADVMDTNAQTQTLDRKGADASSKATHADVSPTSHDPNAPSPSTPSIPSTPPSPSMASHARSKTTSHIDVVGQGKRLSLQFPIQPTAAGSASPAARPRSRPQSWMNGQTSTPLSEPTPASEVNILSVLAAQERYVLELRDELNKAEVDLKTLKKYYQQHEASKVVRARRGDTGKVAQLQPLNTLLANDGTAAPEEDSVSLQREMERRKALLSSTKKPERKVFSGSRHLRTLSLLSPDRQFSPSFPQPLDVQEDAESTDKLSQAPPRSSTSSDLSRPHLNGIEERYDLGGIQNIQRENIIRAGTQMANDFKTGLFTFIEDLRQATVGDEAVNDAEGNLASANARRPSVKSTRKPADGRPPLNRAASSKKSVQRPGSFGDDFWKEMGLSEPKTTALTKKTHTAKNIQTPQKPANKAVEDEEDWDNWDTPNEATVGKLIDLDSSSDESEGHTSQLSGQASSRTSTQSIQYHSKRHDSKASSINNGPMDDVPPPRDSKRNSIPWSDLVKLSPNNLKRTASHLMKEWEKQLTPPPESRTTNFTHGDYIGRSGSPTGLP